MPNKVVVVIGASAGGVEAVAQLVHELPADFPAAVLIVIHFPSTGKSMMAGILNRKGKLRAYEAEPGMELTPGQIYIARPDYHLMVQDGNLQLSHGPLQSGFRPAVDILFSTAAHWYGPRAIGVILSGSLDDGTLGLVEIKRRGGIAVVQDPEDALYPDMPQNAIEYAHVDYVVPLAAMPSLLVRLVKEVGERAKEDPVAEDREEKEAEIVRRDKLDWSNHKEYGKPSVLTCPDCGGVLWEFDDGNLLRFRCHVGHSYSIETLLEQQGTELESALWAAARALEERASISRRMARRSEHHDHPLSAERFARQAEEAEHRAQVIRQVLENSKLPEEEPGEG